MRRFAEIDKETRRLLATIHLRMGRRAKAALREAWECGVYSHELARDVNDESVLQRLRNSHGPSWLAKVSLKGMLA